jgi:hypothetical protein
VGNGEHPPAEERTMITIGTRVRIKLDGALGVVERIHRPGKTDAQNARYNVRLEVPLDDPEDEETVEVLDCCADELEVP